MGFTEAELGFVLAALFAAIAATTLHERDGQSEAAVQWRVKYDSVVSASKEHHDSTRKESQTLRDSLSALRDSLNLTKRSTKTPACWEKGEQRGPIAEVVVLGRNRYGLRGETLDLDGVSDRLAGHIARSKSLGCRYSLRARLSSGVDAIQQSQAVWQLRRNFDVDDRPE